MDLQLLRSHWHGLQHEPPFFYGTDSRELYEHNLRVQSSDWIWRTRSVRYTVNSQGYRCPEFSTIDWANSIVMFGCSYQFAPGVDDSDTMSSQLQRILGLPVVNLGQGATDDLFQWANTVRIASYGIRPLAAVYLWPGVHRLSTFKDSASVDSWGPWNCHLNPLAKEYALAESHSRALLDYYAASVDSMLGCPTLHYYAYNYGPEDWGRIRAWGCVRDSARDLGLTGAYHPGPETLLHWTRDYIVRDLVKLGFNIP